MEKDTDKPPGNKFDRSANATGNLILTFIRFLIWDVPLNAYYYVYATFINLAACVVLLHVFFLFWSTADEIRHNADEIARCSAAWNIHYPGPSQLAAAFTNAFYNQGHWIGVWHWWNDQFPTVNSMLTNSVRETKKEYGGTPCNIGWWRWVQKCCSNEWADNVKYGQTSNHKNKGLKNTELMAIAWSYWLYTLWPTIVFDVLIVVSLYKFWFPPPPPPQSAVDINRIIEERVQKIIASKFDEWSQLQIEKQQELMKSSNDVQEKQKACVLRRPLRRHFRNPEET